MKPILPASLFAVLLTTLSPGAETVRISFLNEGTTLDSTVKFLKRSGCTDEAAAAFQRAVERYNSFPRKLDLDKFPRAEEGFYYFKSSHQILAALRHKLRDTPHPWDLNCYDAVILVTAGQLRTGLRPDDVYGLSLSPQVTTNGEISVLQTATARDAFNWSCPPWYQKASETFFPHSALDGRINLMAGLYSFYVLPSSTDAGNWREKVMQTLRASWKRQAITFPSKCEVVLCHEVRLDLHTFGTSHAGLLFPANTGYTYLEKDGGCGPFVRLDFDVRAELLAWLSGKFDARSAAGPAHVIASFNDTKVEEVDIGK